MYRRHKSAANHEKSNDISWNIDTKKPECVLVKPKSLYLVAFCMDLDSQKRFSETPVVGIIGIFVLFKYENEIRNVPVTLVLIR